ncbi:hypothetical protein EB061_00070 [bacterium]|nr:hypothetical protein [bacterium]
MGPNWQGSRSDEKQDDGMKRFFLLYVLANLSACASSPVSQIAGLPGWVDHPEKALPPERFLVTVGSGSTREEAVRDAKKQMAEVFQTRVQSLTRVRSDSQLRQSTEGAQSGSSGQEINKETTFESNVRIRGAEVKEMASAGGSTYVLLALDKLAARSGLLLEATQRRGRLDALLDSLEAAHQVLKWAQAKAELEQLTALSGEASTLGAGSLVETASLEQRLQKIESDLREKNEKKIFLVRTIKGDEQFGRSLEICIQDQGARVSVQEGKAEAPVHQVLVTVVEHPEHFSVEGWVKVRYEVTANVIDPSGRSYRISEQKSEIARSREAGLELASGEISRGLCQKLWNRIGEMR